MSESNQTKKRKVGFFIILLTVVVLSYFVGFISYAQAGGGFASSLPEGLLFALEWLIPLVILSLATKFIASILENKLSFRNNIIATAIIFIIMLVGYNSLLHGALEIANKHS